MSNYLGRIAVVSLPPYVAIPGAPLLKSHTDVAPTERCPAPALEEWSVVAPITSGLVGSFGCGLREPPNV